MQHVSHLVQSGSERLSDHGSDRTYNIFQCLANTNLPRIIYHGPDPQAMLLQVGLSGGFLGCGGLLLLGAGSAVYNAACGEGGAGLYINSQAD
jgi:hypothetical protein